LYFPGGQGVGLCGVDREEPSGREDEDA